MDDDIKREVSKRRTFAIISHPDAGKTTMTEKLLLYGGAIHLAGSVKKSQGRRQTASDWMEIERDVEGTQRRSDELDHDASVLDVADIHLDPAITLPTLVPVGIPHRVNCKPRTDSG